MLRRYTFYVIFLQIFEKNCKKGEILERPDWFWMDFARSVCVKNRKCLNFGVFPHNRLAFRLKRPIEQAHVALNKHRIFPGRNDVCDTAENYDDNQKLLNYKINLPVIYYMA
jgi:hypothetical protein